MRSTRRRRELSAILVMLSVSLAGAAFAAMPRPVVRFAGAEQYWVGPQAWVRYRLDVDNARDFDQRMFGQTADIHECLASTTAALVVVVDVANPSQAIHRYCPRDRNALSSIRYALPKRKSYTGIVMVQIIDRRINATTWSAPIQTVAGRPPVTGAGRGGETPPVVR